MTVLQPWVCDLSFMQQSVLIASIRGPDGIRKDHPVKVLMRWYRRCVLYSAFEKVIFTSPFTTGGGSFTGPACLPVTEDESFKKYGKHSSHVSWEDVMNDSVDLYLRSVDELPHHFQLHLMHAAEIIGYA